MRRLIILLFLMQSGMFVFAGMQTQDSLGLVGLFDNDVPLEIDLKANFVSLFADLSEDRVFHDAQLTVKNPSCAFSNMPIKLKPRGGFRLRKQTCDFPPLRFKFHAKQVDGTIFQGQDKLKYVSHCQNFKKDYELHTLEEFLVYKMYNVFTDYSYRVRLARVNFIDTYKLDTLQRFGFFVEDRLQMAKRIGRHPLKFRNIKQYQVLRENMLVLSLFQYMVGNSDWDVSRLHNIDLMSVDDNSLPVAIPYDFDWCALIGQEYFVPDPQIDLDAKYQRRYKSYQWTKEEFEAAFQEFFDHKDELYSLISDFTYLDNDNRLKLLAYISEFYDLISSKSDVRDFIMKNAKKIPSDY